MKKLLQLKVVLFPILIFLLNGQTLFSQENNNKAIKLYTNFGWNRTEEIFNFDTTNLITTIEQNQETQLGYFTPSIAVFSPNGNFQEFELSRLLFNRTSNLTSENTDQTTQITSGQRKTNIFIALRYEYDILLFKKKKGSKVQPYMGFSVSPYFSNSSNVPATANLYPTHQNKVGTSFFVIPRLNYNLNEKWFLDLNMPISLIDFNWTLKNNQDPTLTEQERRTSTLEFSTFPRNFLIRFGVGFRI